MKTTLLSLAAAASVLVPGCETAPHHNIQVNQGNIHDAGCPVRRVMRDIPYSPPGTVNIPIGNWAEYENLKYQQRLRDAENRAFVEKHLLGW